MARMLTESELDHVTDILHQMQSLVSSTLSHPKDASPITKYAQSSSTHILDWQSEVEKCSPQVFSTQPEGSSHILGTSSGSRTESHSTDHEMNPTSNYPREVVSLSPPHWTSNTRPPSTAQSPQEEFSSQFLHKDLSAQRYETSLPRHEGQIGLGSFQTDAENMETESFIHARNRMESSPSSPWWERMHEDSVARQALREAANAHKEHHRAVEEMRSCSFHPSRNPSPLLSPSPWAKRMPNAVPMFNDVPEVTLYRSNTHLERKNTTQRLSVNKRPSLNESQIYPKINTQKYGNLSHGGVHREAAFHRLYPKPPVKKNLTTPRVTQPPMCFRSTRTAERRPVKLATPLPTRPRGLLSSSGPLQGSRTYEKTVPSAMRVKSESQVCYRSQKMGMSTAKPVREKEKSSGIAENVRTNVYTKPRVVSAKPGSIKSTNISHSSTNSGRVTFRSTLPAWERLHQQARQKQDTKSGRERLSEKPSMKPSSRISNHSVLGVSKQGVNASFSKKPPMKSSYPVARSTNIQNSRHLEDTHVMRPSVRPLFRPNMRPDPNRRQGKLSFQNEEKSPEIQILKNPKFSKSVSSVKNVSHSHEKSPSLARRIWNSLTRSGKTKETLPNSKGTPESHVTILSEQHSGRAPFSHAHEEKNRPQSRKVPELRLPLPRPRTQASPSIPFDTLSELRKRQSQVRSRPVKQKQQQLHHDYMAYFEHYSKHENAMPH